MVDLALAALVWLAVIGAIGRGLRQERHLNHFALRVWIIFILIALVFTFRCAPVERLIDARFGGKPVTFWLNALSTLGAAVVYAASVRQLVDVPGHRAARSVYPSLIAASGFIMLGLCLILASTFAEAISRQEAQYSMRWLLEVYILLLLGVMLIPVNVDLLRRESIAPMRVKHTAVIISLAAYAVGAVAAAVFIPPILITGEVNPYPDSVPRVPIGAACLVVMLLPHKYLRTLLLPLHLCRYRRIAALERFVHAQVGFEREPLIWRQALHPQAVEIATYVAVINILDYYRRLRADDPDTRAIAQQVALLLPTHPAYDDLVHALSRVRL